MAKGNQDREEGKSHLGIGVLDDDMVIVVPVPDVFGYSERVLAVLYKHS